MNRFDITVMEQTVSVMGILLLSRFCTFAASPVEAIKVSTDEILSQLNHSNPQDFIERNVCRHVVQTEMDKLLDWNEITRACLDRHWAELEPREKEEFVSVFSRFLKERFSRIIVSSYPNLGKIDYREDETPDYYWHWVKLVLTTRAKGTCIIEYRMATPTSSVQWKVYDVAIDGSSLIKLYRDTFDAIILKSSTGGLLKRIKTKLEVQLVIP